MAKLMERFMNFFQEKIVPPMVKVGEQRHLKAVRKWYISHNSFHNNRQCVLNTRKFTFPRMG